MGAGGAASLQRRRARTAVLLSLMGSLLLYRSCMKPGTGISHPRRSKRSRSLRLTVNLLRGGSSFGNFGSNPFGGGGFGGGNTNPFGGGSTGGFGQQTSSTGSLFGQPQANQAQMGGGFSGTSIFGQPQQQQSTPNIFSTPKPAGVSSGAFGGVGQSGSIFGSPVGGNAFSPFGTKPPSMSAYGYTPPPTPAYSQTSFLSQMGSQQRAPYTRTIQRETGKDGIGYDAQYMSISAMAAYSAESVEEIRWADYQAGRTPQSSPYPSTPSFQTTPSSPFAITPPPTPAAFSVFGSSLTPPPTNFMSQGASTQAFGGARPFSFQTTSPPSMAFGGGFGSATQQGAFFSPNAVTPSSPFAPRPFTAPTPAPNLFSGQIGAPTPSFSAFGTPPPTPFGGGSVFGGGLWNTGKGFAGAGGSAFGGFQSAPPTQSYFSTFNQPPQNATPSFFSTPPPSPSFGFGGATFGKGTGGSVFGSTGTTGAIGSATPFGSGFTSPGTSGGLFGGSQRPGFGVGATGFGAGTTGQTTGFGFGGQGLGQQGGTLQPGVQAQPGFSVLPGTAGTPYPFQRQPQFQPQPPGGGLAGGIYPSPATIQVRSPQDTHAQAGGLSFADQLQDALYKHRMPEEILAPVTGSTRGKIINQYLPLYGLHKPLFDTAPKAFQERKDKLQRLLKDFEEVNSAQPDSPYPNPNPNPSPDRNPPFVVGSSHSYPLATSGHGGNASLGSNSSAVSAYETLTERLWDANRRLGWCAGSDGELKRIFDDSSAHIGKKSKGGDLIQDPFYREAMERHRREYRRIFGSDPKEPLLVNHTLTELKTIARDNFDPKHPEGEFERLLDSAERKTDGVDDYASIVSHLKGNARSREGSVRSGRYSENSLMSWRALDQDKEASKSLKGLDGVLKRGVDSADVDSRATGALTEEETSHLLPSIRDPAYFTVPSRGQLARTLRSHGPQALATVTNFTIGHRDFGKVQFHGKTDIRGLDVVDVVQFHRGTLEVYGKSTSAPPIGKGLNKPATVMLYGVHPPESAEDKYEKEGGYEEYLKGLTEEQGAHFLGYDSRGGIWRMTVKHF
ncbi:hypothetical protein AAMO2058_000394500 [Amorphochlora amoebiformis]